MTTTNKPNAPVTIEVEKLGVEFMTRERRYGRGANGGAISLTVSHERKVFVVRWNANRGRGRGWMKGWRTSRRAEAEAMAFAEEKWSSLVAWLEQLEPATIQNGAVAAFSAQVASMMR